MKHRADRKQFFWQGEMWYTFVVCFTKISILLLYLRIFPKTVGSLWFRYTVWSLIGVCAAANTAFVLSIIFQCDPVVGAYKAWDGTVEAKCFNNNAQIIAMAGINILLDLLVFFLPVPKLVKLEISTRKKIGVCLTFMTGLFVTIVSIVRLVKFIQHYDSANITWDFVPIGNWSQFEVNVGIWCACMPALARLIKRFWVEVLGQKLSSYFSRGEHTNRTKTSSFIRTKGSHASRIASGSEVELRGDVEALPAHAVAKTVEARVVYDTRHPPSSEADSEDKREEDKESMDSANAMYHQHRYIRDW